MESFTDEVWPQAPSCSHNSLFSLFLLGFSVSAPMFAQFFEEMVPRTMARRGIGDLDQIRGLRMMSVFNMFYNVRGT